MMPYLASDCPTGYPDIDRQHDRIFEQLEVATRAAHADDLAGTKRALQELGDAIMAHFAGEESLMAATAYPDRVRHKSAHDLFMQDFVQLTRELDSTGLCAPTLLWISARVPEWIKFHIRVNDEPLGRHLARAPRPAPGGRPARPVKTGAS
ncbi:MAG TPA: hemerythrin family protein [Anaeromyxobacteraceae bacterium]|nr:hemerythrin family protein [Anaeromyxobacteraceae bacterium]